MASELRVNTLKDASGNNSIATSTVSQGSAKAWCYLDGYDAEIDDSFNITHETDEGTGSHQVSITSPMANATFAIANNRARNPDGRTGYDEMTCNDKATDGFSLNTSQTSNNAGQDNRILDAIVFGDLA